MKLPKQMVMIVGVPKAGTTTIYDALVKHKELALPSVKEPSFFNEDPNYKWGLQYYLDNYFGGVDDQRVYVDCSTLYSGSAESAERIRKDFGPDTKIVLILRNPVDRAYSHYLHNKKDEIYRNNESFEDVVDKKSSGFDCADCVWYSKYHTIIKIWEKQFGRNNMLILLFEKDVAGDLQQGVDKICDFIGVSRIRIQKPIQSNAARTSRIGLGYVRKFVFTASWLKNIVKKFVHPHHRQKYRMLFDDITSRKIVDKQKPNEKTRKYLYEKYLGEEMEKLKADYGIDYTLQQP